MHRVFELFVSKFAEFRFLQTPSVLDNNDKKSPSKFYSPDDDIDSCVYIFQKLLSILRWSTTGTWSTLANSNVSTPKSDEALFSISKCNISPLKVRF